jgi:methylated-DNA-[protein]-cysteine S-methyltransferase
MSIERSYFNSPIGTIEIKVSNQSVCSIIFTDTERRNIPIIENTTLQESIYPLTKICHQQLAEYFNGVRTIFELPLEQVGTAFQQKVWSELTTIPFGKTINYLALSKKIGNSKAIRAVGTANGKNLICIAIPCHRVIGSNGELKGYNGDQWRKKWLLEHEGKNTNGIQTSIEFTKDKS